MLFGLGPVTRDASRRALRAAAELDRRLQALRATLLAELGYATEHAIYVHTGIATIGEIGDPAQRTTIAVGTAIDAVTLLTTADDAAVSADGKPRIVASRAIFRAARSDETAVEWRALARSPDVFMAFTRIDAARAERCASGTWTR